MRTKIIEMVTILFTIAFLVGCAGVPKPGLSEAKGVAKEALTKPTVEVLEVKMEKTSDKIVITGKAIYRPAKVGAKAFKDYMWNIRFDVYDEAGIKLFHVDGAECGEYEDEADVKPNEPSPFKHEREPHYFGQEKFLKAKTVKVARFEAIGGW